MKYRTLLQQILSVLVLLILLIYTYGNLFVEPYVGINIPLNDGVITHLFAIVGGSDQLQIGDKVEKVGAVTLEMFQSDLNQPFFENLGPGDAVEITV